MHITEYNLTEFKKKYLMLMVSKYIKEFKCFLHFWDLKTSLVVVKLLKLILCGC